MQSNQKRPEKASGKNDGWFAVPNRWIDEGGLHISGAELKTLLAIARRAGGAGRVGYPSLSRIGKDAGVSRAHVSRSIVQLEADGTLQRTQRGGRDGSTTHYRVTFKTKPRCASAPSKPKCAHAPSLGAPAHTPRCASALEKKTIKKTIEKHHHTADAAVVGVLMDFNFGEEKAKALASLNRPLEFVQDVCDLARYLREVDPERCKTPKRFVESILRDGEADFEELYDHRAQLARTEAIARHRAEEQRIEAEGRRCIERLVGIVKEAHALAQTVIDQLDEDDLREYIVKYNKRPATTMPAPPKLEPRDIKRYIYFQNPTVSDRIRLFILGELDPDNYARLKEEERALQARLRELNEGRDKFNRRR